MAIIAVGFIGVYAMRYNLTEVYHYYSEGAFYVLSVLIGVITFVINLCLERINTKKISIFRCILTWLTFIIQYIVHLSVEAWAWLDPNDGPPSIPEFIGEGIVPVVISFVICLIIYVSVCSAAKKD